MKKFVMTGWLKNSGEASLGGNNDKEFEGFCEQGLYPLSLNNSF